MRSAARPTYALGRIFVAPAVLGIVSAVGLTTALMGDGAWDVASWLCLGLPTTLALWYGRPRRRS